MKQDDMIAYAVSLCQTPFKHQGRLPGIALDCAGTIAAICEKFGYEYVDRYGYGRNPSNGQLEETMEQQPSMVRVYGEIEPCDVLIMHFGGEPRHLAFCTGENIVHGYEAVGIVCEHRFASVWRAKVTHIYRFKDLM